MQSSSRYFAFITVFLVIGFMFSHTVVVRAATTKNTKAQVVTPETHQIESIKNSVVEHTPEMISKPIIKSIETFENFRHKIAISSEKHKVKPRTELKDLNNEDENEGAKPEKNYIKKAALYVQIFFFFAVHLIFAYAVLFHAVFVALIFYIIRYLFRLFR